MAMDPVGRRAQAMADQAIGLRVDGLLAEVTSSSIRAWTHTPMSDSWVSSPSAPPTIAHGGENYVRTFWSVTALDPMTSQGSAQIQQGTGTANDSHFGGSWTVSAKLYYLAFGGGNGTPQRRRRYVDRRIRYPGGRLLC